MIEFQAHQEPWRPATSGERLLFNLTQNHRECRELSRLLIASEISLGRRFSDWTNFFIGASTLHLQQRLIRLAHDVRERCPSDRGDQAAALKELIPDTLALDPTQYASSFDELIDEVITSAEQSQRKIPQGLKKKIIGRYREPKCYSCGREFGVVHDETEGVLTATADHVWPRALGGDSTEDNLLAACEACNHIKGHIATWHMAWIQPIVISDSDTPSGLSAVRREVKMALHMRAATAYAHKSGTTLKDAFVAIGPRQKLEKIDETQGYDFFNMRVHDEGRTGIKWTPA